MNENYEFYVYAHYRKSDGRIFYIGKGCGNRIYDTRDRSKCWKGIVKNNGITFEFVAKNLNESDAFKLEKVMIAKYGRLDIKTGVLCNMTDGGDGASGLIMSDSAKDKVRKAQLGNTTWCGRKHKPETLIKMRQPKSEETKQKMRKPKSDAMRKKLSEARKIKIGCSNGMIFESGVAAVAWLRETCAPKAHGSSISDCLKGKLKTAYGFTWHYI